MIYLHDVLDVPELKYEVRETMLQSAAALIKRYPEEFSFEMMQEHIGDLLLRFQNRALGDTIYRVGCDLKRKLGSNDRISGAIKLSRDMDLPYDKMLKALVCGCHFRATSENGKIFPGDIEFAAIYESGIRNVLTRICGFDEKKDKQLIEETEKMDKEIAGFSIKLKQ